jgi:hypothetical protein
MKRVWLLTIIVLNTLIAFGCDCLENNHALAELDEYSQINARMIAILEGCYWTRYYNANNDYFCN